MHKLGFIINAYINKNFLGVLTFNEDIDEDNFVVKTYGKKIPYIRGKPLALIEKVKYQEPKYKGDKIDYYDSKSRDKFYKELKIKNSEDQYAYVKYSNTYENYRIHKLELPRGCNIEDII